MKKKLKNENESKQREQYLKKDFGDILSKLDPVDLDLDFPAPTQSISLRLPREVLNKIRVIADEQDIPYQSLIKLWLVEKLKKVS